MKKNFTRTTVYQIKSVTDQVEQALRAYISDNNLKVGSILPSELALSELFSVSRMTLRKGLKRLSMDGIIASRPGVGHMVLSERPLRKYVLLFGLDPLAPRSSSFHQKLAYWLRKLFTQEETEPAFVVLDREDHAAAKLSEIRRRLSIGEFGGAVLVHWSEYIAPLEQEILASSLPFLSISTQSPNPNRLILRQWDLVVKAYHWLAKQGKLPATAICTDISPKKSDLQQLPGLTVLRYKQVPDVYHLTRTALASAPKAIIVPDDVAQAHAQAAILAGTQSTPPILAHLAIKGDMYPAGIPRLLLEVDPQKVAGFCLQWLRDFSAASAQGDMPVHLDLISQS